jgi:hypothetical protein
VGEKFVKIQEVNDTIRGALAEVHFKVHHFPIRKHKYDSFNGDVNQIIVLQPGEASPVLPYEERKVQDGPIRMQPTIALLNTVLSGSQLSGGTSDSQPADDGDR